ncbi:alpha-(1,3)-fucosyltransferase fut-6-like [Styela clava]
MLTHSKIWMNRIGGFLVGVAISIIITTYNWPLSNITTSKYSIEQFGSGTTAIRPLGLRPTAIRPTLRRKQSFTSETYTNNNITENKAIDSTTSTTHMVTTQARREKITLNTAYLDAILKQKLLEATEKKIIVMWYGMIQWGQLNAAECGNCEITYNRSRLSDDQTGAAVFYFEGISPQTMPPLAERNPKHIYVFWSLESPSTVLYRYHRPLFYEDKYEFNASLTHRRDSDFYNKFYIDWDIGYVMNQRRNKSPLELLKKKNRTAVIVISDCDVNSVAKHRMDIVNQIKNMGYKLEGYGKCFPESGIFADGAGRGNDKFFKEIRKYKFYFSLENSYHCKDYITEKFFKNALWSFTVPVVWGATKEDYLAFAPNGSFIHAEDFNSWKDLVDYLNYLDKNDTAYLEYFSWHQMDINKAPKHKGVDGICHLCRALHGINHDDIYNNNFDPANHPRPLFDDKVSPRPAISLRDWFYNKDNQECFDKYY